MLTLSRSGRDGTHREGRTRDFGSCPAAGGAPRRNCRESRRCAWSETQIMGHQLAGGNSSWCPELNV